MITEDRRNMNTKSKLYTQVSEKYDNYKGQRLCFWNNAYEYSHTYTCT